MSIPYAGKTREESVTHDDLVRDSVLRIPLIVRDALVGVHAEHDAAEREANQRSAQRVVDGEERGHRGGRSVLSRGKWALWRNGNGKREKRDR